ncbi:MAG: glycoside hydrolase family 127 protein [Planctomycetes bacterium]|nr:glycoside hydrolase family 127 protein [Planctomycetota bacterium]
MNSVFPICAVNLVVVAALTASVEARFIAPEPESAANQPQHANAVRVKIADAFWAPRREVNRKVSLQHGLDMLDKFGNIADLELAAAGKREGFKGPVYIDSDMYKCIESASMSLGAYPDAQLEARVDGIIAKIAAAQRPDGYLNTWYEVNAPDKRFSNLRDHHELYCAGHLFEAAVAHKLATGKTTLLDVATKYADLLCDTFGDGPGKRAGYCGHPEIELALVKLADETGRAKYTDLATYFINARGSHFFATEHATPKDQYNGEYWLDSVPVREQTCPNGHAVRFGYLMSACVDIGAARQDDSLLKMARRVWRNTAERNTYLTGGIGPSAGNEGFTHDYDLPNLSAYQETCASVAMAMWNHRMNVALGDSVYADCVETALYNGILSGVSLDGTRFFYVNPLASMGNHHRSEWFGCACCPPNVMRTLASLGDYAYSVRGRDLWVNLYVQGQVATTIDSHELGFDVTTDYPWDGEVSFATTADTNARATVHFRVPGWCEGAGIELNGQRVDKPEVVKGYIVIDREWKKGDRVALSLPMPVRRVEANPNLAENRGRLAIARGPLVYCVEGADIDAPFWSFAVPADAALTTSRRPDLLGGVVTIQGTAVVAQQPEWTGTLYRTSSKPRSVGFTAIPYYAWDNRSPGPMQVWLPSSPPPPRITGPESSAKVGVSYLSNIANPEGIHDGAEPGNSAEQPAALCHWWPHKGGTEWVGYTWSMPVTLGSARVYWFDDTGRGECRVPKSWRLLFKEGDEWKPVDATGPFPVAKDRWCEVTFKPVKTTELRLEVSMQDQWSAGVHEWKVELHADN